MLGAVGEVPDAHRCVLAAGERDWPPVKLAERDREHRAKVLVAGALVILLAVLASWAVTARRRSTVHNGVTEEQARQNAAPLTTAILSGSRPRVR